MHPIKIRQSNLSTILITWSDGHESPLTLESLRDSCPCAGCKGETVLLRTYSPPELDRGVPGRNELKAISPVGSYALKLTWGDSHDMGMYTWDLLRSLCECPECLDVKFHRGAST
jgi:DUF971 family protein